MINLVVLPSSFFSPSRATLLFLLPIVLLSTNLSSGQQLQVNLTSITDPTGLVGDSFGYSVATLNGITVVGSSAATRNGYSNCGIANIFHYDSVHGIWILDQQFSLQSPVPNDNFGWAVAMMKPPGAGSLPLALVSAPYRSRIFPQDGILSLLQQDSTNSSKWNNVTTLFAPDAAPGDTFAYSVSASGDTIICGAPTKTSNASNSGIAYLFSPNFLIGTWMYKKSLYPSDPGNSYSFGYSCSIDGDHALVAATNANYNSTIPAAGSAYFFYRNFGGHENWGQQVKISSPLPTTGSLFGDSLSISGDNAFVGSPYLNSNTGAAYHFVRQLGGQDQWGFSNSVPLPAPPFTPGSYAGGSVAIAGQYALMGAAGVGGLAGPNTGEVLLLQLSSDGLLLNTIASISDPLPENPADRFGNAVSLDLQMAVIGCNGRNSGTGSVFSFVLPSSSPPSPPSTPPTPRSSTLLLIIIFGVVGVAGGAAIIMIVSRRKKKNAIVEDSLNHHSPLPDGLLEFSPRKDMEFIDMHSASGHKPNPETASIASGTSLSSRVSLKSRATVNSTSTSLTTDTSPQPQ